MGMARAIVWLVNNVWGCDWGAFAGVWGPDWGSQNVIGNVIGIPMVFGNVIGWPMGSPAGMHE